uniref:Phosphatidylinositol transfer protein n=1 Tax=Trepomonas sp. PC1 TaxID=1076344 RepID=A0A146KBI2_9EUKA|eukprot:JAP93284.1 Phosphatidylinositol transfer protein [Trepomonas sp. PC1]
MKYLILCFKVPYSYEKSKIASIYSSIQGEKSHNNNSENPIYQRDPYSIDDNGFTHGVAKIFLKNYKNKLVQAIIPSGCELIEKHTSFKWPYDFSRFVIVNKPQLGGAEHCTFITSEKVDYIPEETAFILGNSRPQIDYVDLTNGYAGECCFIYKVLKYEINIFGSSLIEPIVAIFYKKIYKTNYVNMIKCKDQWENYTEEEAENMKTGVTVVQIAQIDDE